MLLRGTPTAVLLRAALHLGIRAMRGKAALAARPELWFPWTSPDVWARVVDHYRALPDPTVFEWGVGVSTIWHVRALLSMGRGTYVGVEHNVLWTVQVAAALLREAAARRVDVSLESFRSGLDADLTLRLGGCRVVLRLRSRRRDEGRPADDRKYEAYVAALDLPVDVVVIDGRARNDCVRRALSTPWLRQGGLLALYEAGRGEEGWFEGMGSGKHDYRREVEEMVRLGGEVVDGLGLDRWEELGRPRTVGPHGAGPYRHEACFLVRAFA